MIELPEAAAGGIAAADGLAYVALLDGTVRAYRLADGTQRWSAALGAAAQTGPACAKGAVVVADSGKRLRAFAADTGARLWDVPLLAQAASEPGAGADAVLLGEGNGGCAAFRLTDGLLLWRQSVLGDVVGAPAVGERWAVFGSTGHTLYAVAKLSGEVSKTIVVSGEVLGRAGLEPAAAGRALTAVGTHDGRVYAFSPSWERLWAVRLRGAGRAAPLVRPNAVYVGTDEGLLAALERETGQTKWETGVGGPVVDRLVVLPGAVVAGAGGALSFIEPASGRPLAVIPVGGLLTGVAEDGGTVVAVTSSRRLIAAGVKAPAPELPVRVAAIQSVVVEPQLIHPGRNERVTVTFSLVERRNLVVDVADARGRRVVLLGNRDRADPGTYRFEWNGASGTRQPAAPGVYRIRVTAGEEEIAMGLEVVQPK